MTVKLQVTVLLAPSVAVQTTVLVPKGKVEPGDGEQVTLTPGQLSMAMAIKVTLLLLAWPESTLSVMPGGQMMVGGCISTTLTMKLQALVLPQASVAVQWTLVSPTGKVEPLGGEQLKLAVEQLSLTETP
jgi:hypothetical protein